MIEQRQWQAIKEILKMTEQWQRISESESSQRAKRKKQSKRKGKIEIKKKRE